MDFNLGQHHLNALKLQRNVLAGLCAALLSANLIQSAYLFFRHERVIITPPQLAQGFWVEGNRFSPQYLEEMALHYARLFLDVTEKSILYQGDIILRSVIPDAYGTFRAKLLEDERRLKANNLSTRFSPSGADIFPDQLKVELTGTLTGYVGDKKVSQEQEVYQIQFQNNSGRLLVASFTPKPKKALEEETP